MIETHARAITRGSSPTASAVRGVAGSGQPSHAGASTEAFDTGTTRDRPLDLDGLLENASALVTDVEADAASAVGRRLTDLRRRLGAERLHVAILGQFKRGKSTVLNALLGEPLLPTAVVRVTAILTYVQAGTSPRVAVSFRGDRRTPEEFTASEATGLERHIHRFVAEEANRDNRLDVAAVQVFLPTPMLSKGIVLIDTPGIGSTLRHNTEATLGFLPQCDVALFVLSVDPPMTQAEAELLATVSGHVPHLVFVLNKVDQIDAAELPAVLAFLLDVLTKQAHVRPRFASSACRPAKRWRRSAPATRNCSRKAASSIRKTTCRRI